MAKRNVANNDKDKLIRRKKQKAQTEPVHAQPNLHQRIAADVQLLHRTMGNAAFPETIRYDPVQQGRTSEQTTLDEDLQIITNRKIGSKKHETITSLMNGQSVPTIQRTLGSEMEPPPAAQFGQGKPSPERKPDLFPTTSGNQARTLEEILQEHNFRQDDKDRIQKIYQAAQDIARILNGKVDYMFGGSFAALLQGNKRIPGDLDIDVFKEDDLKNIEGQLTKAKYEVKWKPYGGFETTHTNGIEIEAISLESFSALNRNEPKELSTSIDGMNLASASFLLVNYLKRYDNRTKKDNESVKNIIQANSLTKKHIDELLKLPMSIQTKEKVKVNWEKVWQEIDIDQNDTFLKQHGYSYSERQTLLNA